MIIRNWSKLSCTLACFLALSWWCERNLLFKWSFKWILQSYVKLQLRVKTGVHCFLFCFVLFVTLITFKSYAYWSCFTAHLTETLTDHLVSFLKPELDDSQQTNNSSLDSDNDFRKVSPYHRQQYFSILTRRILEHDQICISDQNYTIMHYFLYFMLRFQCTLSWIPIYLPFIIPWEGFLDCFVSLRFIKFVSPCFFVPWLFKYLIFLQSSAKLLFLNRFKGVWGG